MRTPAEFFEHAERPIPCPLPPQKSPDDYQARRVRRDGSIKWRCCYVFLGEAPSSELVGLEPREDGYWLAHLGRMRMSVRNERPRTALPLQEGDE